MRPLRYIVEPSALWLTWQSTEVGSSDRSRRIVGQLLVEGDAAVFRYLRAHPDFAAAKQAGFQGHPAFDLKANAAIGAAALDPFLRRIPPRKREDFSAYLALHLLPDPFPASNVALLGYTGARLPSDGFVLLPAFSAEDVPLDFVAEVAGLRHTFFGDVSAIRLGDEISLRHDASNPIEADAVAFYWRDVKLGYISRVLRQRFLGWIRERSVRGEVARVNGTPSRPLVYVRIEVR